MADGHKDVDLGKQSAISKWSRNTLEDTYLRLYDEQHSLKKHARKQEEKIKRMATKLLRLLNDKKGQVKDIQQVDQVDEMKKEIQILTKENRNLKEAQMLQRQSSARKPYGNITSRVNTGMVTAATPYTPAGLNISRRRQATPIGAITARGGGDFRSQGNRRYGHSLLEETRTDCKILQNINDELKNTINDMESKLDEQKLMADEKAKEFEDDLIRIKQKMSSDQRIVIQENIDVIRLQRDVKEKTNKLASLQNNFQALSEKQMLIKGAHEQVLREMGSLNDSLKLEQQKNLQLQSQVNTGECNQRLISEMQERLMDKDKETIILKESNEKLVKSAFDLEREREWRQRETALKIQIAQLEATVKADVGEKGTILDRLTVENDAHEELQTNHKEMKINFFELKHKYDELKDKMNFFTKESSIDMADIEEALALVQARKSDSLSSKPEFIVKVEEEKQRDLQSAIKLLRSEHAETIMELEKTRNLLIVQYRINKDYQLEVVNSTQKVENVKSDADEKITEMGQLLDIRNMRIQNLEKQLKEIAYGSRKYMIQKDEKEEEEDDIEESIDLMRGENLLEINVTKLCLNEEALKILDDKEPSLFCTWDFYEFVIQSTPIVKNSSPEFNFTSKYIVKVDDFLLHYLEQNVCKLEVHMSYGVDYRTIAETTLKLSDLLHESQTKICNSAILTGIENSSCVFGSLNYWVRMRIPMPQAMRLYQERSAARGFITANQSKTEDSKMLSSDDLNELSVTISTLNINKSLYSEDLPSVYCAYKLFDFSDHMTSTAPSGLSPVFDDFKQFPLTSSNELHTYLTSKMLTIYAFDDSNPSDSIYIGVVQVPLIPLAHGKEISGGFELTNCQGSKVGTIDLEIKWKFKYEPMGCMNIVQTIEKEQTKSLDLLSTGAEVDTAISHAPLQSDSHVPSLPASSRHKPQQHPGPVDQLATAAPTYAAVSPPAGPTPSTAPAALPSALSAMEDSDGEIVVSQSIDDATLPATAAAAAASQPGDQPSILRPTYAQVTGSPPGHELPEAQPTPSSISPSGQNPQIRKRDLKNVTFKGELEDNLQTEDLSTLQENETEENKNDDISGSSATLTDNSLSEKSENDITEQISEIENTDEDTMFEDEDIASTDMASSSDDVIVASASKDNNNISVEKSDVTEVSISHLYLTEECKALKDKSIKMLYVAYRFLGVPPDETETPFSLPKPTSPHQYISFNFTKVFHVDYNSNYERRQYLAGMLLPDDPDHGRVRFTLVSEPDDNKGECQDIGQAFISVHDVLEKQADVIDRDMPVYDMDDSDLVIGYVNLSLKCLHALVAVKSEMKQIEYA